MTSRERFLAAATCQPVDRPPVWLMRQAGRYLPEYRALKEKHAFTEMVRTPALATELTLQPLRRFPDLDAAIVFSDILVVPEALGQPYRFPNGGGIEMEFSIGPGKGLGALNGKGVAGRLEYLAETLRRLRTEIGARALLGFAGSPWTLAVYMTEGRGPGEAGTAEIVRLAKAEPAFFEDLMSLVSEAVGASLAMQIEAGADAVQIFDSWASLCGPEEYEALSLRWIRQVVGRLPRQVPTILFARGKASQASDLADTGVSVLGLDWQLPLPVVRGAVGARCALQGNLHPEIALATPDIARAATRSVLEQMRNDPGYIFNFGHGLTPGARVETVGAIIDTVARFS